MARKNKYTPAALDKAVKRYFLSISREITVTVMIPTGELDKYGHEICKPEPVINALGEPMKRVEFLIPPTVGGLANYLGIHRDTWNAYCQDPAFSDTATYARGQMHAYLEQETLTRKGADLKGVLFNLENNYGYSEKVSLTTDTVEDFLKRQAGGGPEF